MSFFCRDSFNDQGLDTWRTWVQMTMMVHGTSTTCHGTTLGPSLFAVNFLGWDSKVTKVSCWIRLDITNTSFETTNKETVRRSSFNKEPRPDNLQQTTPAGMLTSLPPSLTHGPRDVHNNHKVGLYRYSFSRSILHGKVPPQTGSKAYCSFSCLRAASIITVTHY